jgi:hypothetical protein
MLSPIQDPVLPRLGAEDYVPIPGQMSFSAFLAGLNPLHHVPVVGSFYRAATGESIPPVMRILGGGLFGGAIGLLSAAVLVAIQEALATPPAALAEPLSGPPAEPHSAMAAPARFFMMDDGHG